MVQFFNYDTPYNLELLTIELRVAFPSAGTDIGVSPTDNANGFVVNCPDGILESAVAVVVAAHDHTGYTDEQLADQVESGSLSQASNIPGWASWTEAQALAWHDNNIGDNIPVANLAAANLVLADMATAQRNLIRMVIALRNKNFPNLQE